MSHDPIPVVELLRVSTALQAADDRAGIPAQHTANLRTAAQLGLHIVETIQVVESGAEVARGPAMARLLTCVTSGRVRGVVLAEFSRLFRPDNFYDYGILQTLADAGAQIYEPSGAINLETEAGAMLAAIKSAFAGHERRQIRARTTRAKEEMRAKGLHVDGGYGISLGLSYSKATGWAYTEKAALVREAFTRFLAGERNYDALSRSLGLARSSVKYVLTNEVYAGWLVYDGRRGKNGERGKRPANEVLRVRLSLEPLVSEADFALVQQIIATKAASVNRTPRDEDFVYKGFLTCAEDGLPIYTHVCPQKGYNTHYRYYCRSHQPNRSVRRGETKCTSGYMSRNRLEPVLDEAIQARLSNPQFILTSLEAYHASLAAEWRGGLSDRVASLEARVTRLRNRRSRVLDAFIDGDIDRAEKDRRLALIQGELAAAEEVLTKATPAAATPVSEADVVELASAFTGWEYLSRLDRRGVLTALAPSFSVRRLPGKRGRFAVDGVLFPLLGQTTGRGNTDSHPKMHRLR